MELSEENLYFSIKSVTQILYRLYCRLAILESQEKDTSLEYEKTLKLIEFYTALEDQYYENVEKLLKKDEEIVERMYVNTLLSTESNFSPEKSLSDPSYMIFHDFKENDVVPMRMATKLYEISIQNSEEANQLGKRVYNEYESQRDTYFIDIIDSMIKDNTYKNFKKMIIKSKYKIAFINNTKKLFVFDSNNPNDHLTIKYIINQTINGSNILFIRLGIVFIGLSFFNKSNPEIIINNIIENLVSDDINILCIQ